LDSIHTVTFLCKSESYRVRTKPLASTPSVVSGDRVIYASFLEHLSQELPSRGTCASPLTRMGLHKS